MKTKISIIQGDITSYDTDAIVNAANPSLMGGGGVDGAIHAAGGPSILRECEEIISKQGKCATGEAVITTAGYLPAKIIIHTVGPVWRGGKDGEAQQLSMCYVNSLHLAANHSCNRIAFPNISTGVYGFPKAQAAQIAVASVLKTLNDIPDFEEVSFICFDPENWQWTQEAYQEQTSGGHI